MIKIFHDTNFTADERFFPLIFPTETRLTDYEQNVIARQLELCYLCTQIHTHYYWLLVIIRLSAVE